MRDRADALFVAPDGFFVTWRVQFATLAARHGIPAAYTTHENVEAGGLMSYGTDIQVGVYTGQILKGANPVDLPAVQSTKFEFVIKAAAREDPKLPKSGSETPSYEAMRRTAETGMATSV